MNERRPRIAVTVDAETDAALDDVARRWFGGNRSAVTDWALRLAALVLADPAVTRGGVPDPVDALRLLCAGDQ
jgi:hypothetical protein